jgi:hypothetical protein
MKNSWEEQSTGRSERAAAALAYYHEKKKREKLVNGGVDRGNIKDEEDRKRVVSTIESNMMELLTQALNGDVNDIKDRYSNIFNLPKVFILQWML